MGTVHVHIPMIIRGQIGEVDLAGNNRAYYQHSHNATLEWNSQTN